VPAAAPDLPLPQVLDTHEVAAALRKDIYTIQRNLREGVIPGIKLPGGRWRVRLDVVEAILAGEPTPEGGLSAEQRDAIAAVFAARPRHTDHRPHSRKRHPAGTTAK
jgi:hypothetical protein